MKQLYIIFLCLSSTFVNAQVESINVADLNFRMTAMSTHQLAYGFAEGDKIIINYSEERGKKLKNFEVIAYQGPKMYSDFNGVIKFNCCKVIKHCNAKHCSQFW